jgi:hypothetical protein
MMQDYLMTPITGFAIFAVCVAALCLWIGRQARIVTDETRAKTRALE